MEATKPPKRSPLRKLKKESSRKPKPVTSLGKIQAAPMKRSDDSSSDSDSDSHSSDEDVKDGDDAARKAAKKRRKAKRKKKAKKMAKKLLKKMIKKEQAKYTHSGFHEVPHNYAQFLGNHSNKKFYSVHLESLLISMGRTIPNGLMICKCTFTGFTLLFGRLWL
jgi:hypothetical protein